MYSPKIAEDLIPKIYRVAKAGGIKQTTLVNAILEQEIDILHEKFVSQGYEKHRSELSNRPVKRKRIDLKTWKLKETDTPRAAAPERIDDQFRLDNSNLKMLTALASDMKVKPVWLLNSILQENLSHMRDQLTKKSSQHAKSKERVYYTISQKGESK